jgi:hypothetical protein
MTLHNLTTRAARSAVVALTAAALSLVTLVLGAGRAGATTRPGVTVRVGAMSHTSGCPQTTEFTARILSQGPALVRYHWVRSDGSSSPQRSLRFRGPGRHSYAVHESWAVPDDSTRWEKLVVTSPDRVSTRRMYFTTYCATQVWVDYATATDSSALCDDVFTNLGGAIAIWGTPPPGVRYYWTVDGTVVGDTTVTDYATIASGEIDPTYFYSFIPPHGTTSHSVVLHAEATDGSSSWDSPATSFTTTCA